MPITNRDSGTNIEEVADGVYRISTPIPETAVPIPGGFTFNQYLIVDEQPLLFHTGLRRMFPLVREAVAHVLPVERLRWISFSHVEADECGALNEWLGAAPRSTPLCGQVAAMVSVNDLAERPPRALADGEELSLGTRRVRWIDAPNVPHNWECGYLFETTARTLLCGDVITQPGSRGPASTEADVVGAVAALESQMHAFSRAPTTGPLIERMARLEPRTLCAMHGSAVRGDGGRTLRDLATALGVS
jgi:flavorubredoxin